MGWPGPDDAGAFGDAVAIYPTPGNAKLPVVAASRTAVHVVWHDFSLSPAGLYHVSSRGGAFEGGPLGLDLHKAIRPDLSSDGEDQVALVWESTRGEGPWLMAALHDGTSFGGAEALGPGEKPVILWHEGTPHVLGFSGQAVVHYRRDEEGWEALNPPRHAHPYLNPFRLAAASTPVGLVLGLATSRGETRHDMRRFIWTEENGWSARETLYESLGLSSDDPHAAVNAAGETTFVWTEQSEDDPWTIGIRRQWPGGAELLVFEPGFAVSPSNCFDSLGVPFTAWVTPSEEVALAHGTHGTPRLFPGRNLGPDVASDSYGCTHLVYYGQGAASQDVFFSSNCLRP